MIAPLPFIVSGLQEKVDRPALLLHPELKGRSNSLDRLAGVRVIDLADISSSIVQSRSSDAERFMEMEEEKESTVSEKTTSRTTLKRVNSESKLLEESRRATAIKLDMRPASVTPPPLDDILDLQDTWGSVMTFNKGIV